MEEARKRPMIPTMAMVAMPLAVAALAYVGDIVIGAANLQVSPSLAIERYAVIAIVFCIIEAVTVLPMLLMRRRYTHAAGMLVYLAVVAAVMAWIGSVQIGA